eukprot:COSAG02_NODE_8519_length_2539_cov_2.833607_2_plen_161_part_00
MSTEQGVRPPHHTRAAASARRSSPAASAPVLRPNGNSACDFPRILGPRLTQDNYATTTAMIRTSNLSSHDLLRGQAGRSIGWHLRFWVRQPQPAAADADATTQQCTAHTHAFLLLLLVVVVAAAAAAAGGGGGCRWCWLLLRLLAALLWCCAAAGGVWWW